MVEIRLVDLGDLSREGKSYDRVVSIEMLEAVGFESPAGRRGPTPVRLDVA